MAEEEVFENLDSLDWSDVENELKANRDQILSEVKAESSGQKEKKEREDDEGEGYSNDPLSKGDIDINFLFDVQLSIIDCSSNSRRSLISIFVRPTSTIMES